LCTCGGFTLSSSFLGIALLPRMLEPESIFCTLGLGQLAIRLATPGLLDSTSPTAEHTGWNAIREYGVPACVILTIPIACKPMELAVRNDRLWRRETSLLNCLAKVVESHCLVPFPQPA
jgi:hypothetical protein